MAGSRNQALLKDLAQQKEDTQYILNLASTQLDLEKRRFHQKEMESILQKEINALEEERIQIIRRNNDAELATIDDINEQIKSNKTLLTLGEKQNVQLKKRNEFQQKFNDLMTKNNWSQAGWIKGLMESDKIIRMTILNLGLSGKKAEMMRSSFEASAKAVTLMGGSLKDIQAVQEGYANETGRARTMTAQMVKDIVSIGRGTGLGVEEAAKLGAQFELMGFDAKTTAEAVQGIVDTSERMGVNTTKVLKGVNDNFKRLQQYSFQNGVKGMLQMSQYATKMNVDMNQALNAADIAKSLEGAIDLAAQLQIMGGEFAKTDPFEMLFLSRNDPAKFTEKINEMTKGVVSFRKMADGTFEKFISPADRQRMAQVEKSLGMQAGELTQQALRMADIQKMRRNMLGSSLSKADKELIEGAAIYNKKTNMFQVQVGNSAKNITDLTESEAKLFAQQQVTLEKRAQDSLTFQESLEAALASFKQTLLPMLRGFTVVMDAVKPFFQWVNKVLDKIPHGLIAAAGIVVGAALLFNVAARNIAKAVYAFSGKNIAGGNGMFARNARNGTPVGGFGGGSGGGTGKAVRGMGTKTMAAQGAMAKAKGMGNMMTGAGVGAAALGVGAGIGAAAVGIGQLAKAIKDVDVEKLKMMNYTIVAIGGTMTAILVPSLFALGAAGTAAAPGLLAIGAAALGIGAGIGIAAAGIGYMANGLGEMINNSKDAGPAMLTLGKGIATMSAGMAAFTVGGLGLITFTATLGAISSFATPIAKVGEAFKQINLAMKGSKEDFNAIQNLVNGFDSKSFIPSLASIASFATPIAKVGNAFKEINLAMSGSKEDFIAIQNAVNAISNMNTGSGNALAQLTNLLKSPIKVEFSDSKVKFISDITLEIDGQKFMQKVYAADVAVQKAVDAKIKGMKR